MLNTISLLVDIYMFLDTTKKNVRSVNVMIETIATDCQADCDGDCYWKDCPQLRDKEPFTSGRHCPLDNYQENEEYL